MTDAFILLLNLYWCETHSPVWRPTWLQNRLKTVWKNKNLSSSSPDHY